MAKYKMENFSELQDVLDDSDNCLEIVSSYFEPSVLAETNAYSLAIRIKILHEMIEAFSRGYCQEREKTESKEVLATTDEMALCLIGDLADLEDEYMKLFAKVVENAQDADSDAIRIYKPEEDE